MLPSQILEKGWCQGFYAYDKDGNYTLPGRSKAITHSIWGAIHACQFSNIWSRQTIRMLEFYMHEIAEEFGYSTIAMYNDSKTTTKDEVVTLMQEAEVIAGIG